MKRDTTPQFVLDCSVTMAWCFEEEVTHYTDSVMNSFENAGAIVPLFWFIEVANVLKGAEKNKRVSLKKVESFLSLLENLPIHAERDISKTYLENIFRLAKDNHLTAYDAVYLDLAIQHTLPIATLDKELQKAATPHRIKIYLE